MMPNSSGPPIPFTGGPPQPPIPTGTLDQFVGGKLPSPQQLLEALKAPLARMLQDQVRATVDVEKIWQYAQLRRNNLYFRGKQNLTLSQSNSGTGVVDYRPVSGQSNMAVFDRATDQYYDAVLNWLRGDVRAFNAVLGARSPNVQALARDPADDTIAGRVRKANRLAQFMRGHCDLDSFHRQLVYSLALNGTTFGFTRYVANASKYGYLSMPRWEWTTVPGGSPYYQCYGCGTETPVELAISLAPPMPGPQGIPIPGPAACMQCGRPQSPGSLITPDPVPSLVQSQPLQFPNGAAELGLYSSDTVSIPFWTRRHLSEAPWLCLEEEADRGAMCQAYPDLRAKITQELYPHYGSNQEMMGRYTRDLFSSPTGYVIARRNQRWSHTRLWYQSWVYEYLPGDQTGYFRELLYKMYPDGLKVDYCNAEPFRLSNEKLTRNWASCKPEPSETVMGDPYFEDCIICSDTINDFVNIMLESGQRSVPLIIFDPDVLQPERIREYASLPGEYLPARAGASGDLSKAFFRAPAAEIPPALVAFIEKFIGWVRDITGMIPTIWGGGEAEPTARATEIKRNQALGRLNIVFQNIRTFHEEVYENLAIQTARFSDGRVFTSKGSPDSVDQMVIDGIEEILKGGWKYWAEEAMPMTPGQRRDWYMNLFQIATANPLAMQLSGLGDPGNLERWQETVGSPDWRTPGLLEREGILVILSVAATLSPVLPLPPPPMATLGGQQPQQPPPGPSGPALADNSPQPPNAGGPAPSGPAPQQNMMQPAPPQANLPMPFEQIMMLYEPTLLVTVIREFMTNPDQGEKIRLTNPAGWQNLVLFLQQVLGVLAAQAAAQQAAQAQQNGGGSGGPNEGPPKGPHPPKKPEQSADQSHAQSGVVNPPQSSPPSGKP